MSNAKNVFKNKKLVFLLFTVLLFSCVNVKTASSIGLDLDISLYDAVKTAYFWKSDIPISGTVLGIPESLEDAALSFIESESSFTSAITDYFTSFLPDSKLMITKDDYYLLISDEEIAEGYITATGIEVIGFSWGEYDVGILIPNNEETSISNTGTPVTVSQLKSNANSYVNDFVSIDATIRTVPLIIDVPEADIRIPANIGRVVENAIDPMDLTGFVDRIYTLINDSCENTICSREEIENILNLGEKSIPIFDFNQGYYLDSEANINAVVLPVDLMTFYIEEYFGVEFTDIFLPTGSDIFLYNINTELDSEDATPEDIYNNPGDYNGKVVTFTGYNLGVNVKVKESIKRILQAAAVVTEGATLAIAEIVELIPLDVTLHGKYILSDDLPTDISEIIPKSILAVGSSNIDQTLPISFEPSSISNINKIRFTGKIIQASLLNKTIGFEHAYIFLIYKTEVVSNLLEDIATYIYEKILNKLDYFSEILQNLNPDLPSIDIIKAFDPKNLNINEQGIKDITIETINDVEDAVLNYQKYIDIPSDEIKDTLDAVYNYYDISFENLDDGDLNNAEIEFIVEKSWLSENDIDKDKITLYRYHDDSWNSLVTTMTQETSDFVYYSAVTPGFSYFAVGFDENNEEEEVPPGETNPPDGSDNPDNNATNSNKENLDINILLVIFFLIIILILAVMVIFFYKKSKSKNNNIKKEPVKKQRTENIGEEVKRVLLLIDEFLGKLPDEVIDDFVKTKDFLIYEKLLGKIKNEDNVNIIGKEKSDNWEIYKKIGIFVFLLFDSFIISYFTGIIGGFPIPWNPLLFYPNLFLYICNSILLFSLFYLMLLLINRNKNQEKRAKNPHTLIWILLIVSIIIIVIIGLVIYTFISGFSTGPALYNY